MLTRLTMAIAYFRKMQLRIRPYSLQFKHPFGVSSNTRRETPTVFVCLQEGEHKGYGEACLPAYLGETTGDTLAFLEKAGTLLQHTNTSVSLDALLDELDQLSIANNAGKAALDIALHDLYAKVKGQSFAEFMGIKAAMPVATSFTIGIDNAEKTREKIEEAAEFSILKIKAGTANDRALIELIRSLTNKPLYVDVNQGWSNTTEAIALAQWMSQQGVLLLEQPMPVNNKDQMRLLSAKSPIPTMADESVKRLQDIPLMDGMFKGVNIKLMKSGGLREAMRMISACRKKNLFVMLGCMAESSCATTAMAQLMGMADFVDLDAPSLYTNDPFGGATYHQGKIKLPTGIGIGAFPLPQFDF